MPQRLRNTSRNRYRPKADIQETRDADEFQQAGLVVRLIYSDPREGPGYLEEIDLQWTIGPGQK